MMSEAVSQYDSDPNSDFDFNDFLQEEGKEGDEDDAKATIMKIRKKINAGVAR